MYKLFENVFKHPLPDAKASPSSSRGEGSRLLRRYTPRNDGVSNGEGLHRPWCQKILGTVSSMTGGRDANSFGRSMIEMLGVLAIIGVLSVGGIAGYSKATEKWKINKAVEQYSYIINGLIKPADELKASGDKSGVMFYEYLTVVEALGLLPPSWSNKHENIGIHDDLGNYLQFFVRNKNVVIDFYLGGIGFETDSWYKSNSFSPKLCQEIVQNVFYPLHSVVNNVYLVKESYYGDAFCASKKCLSGIKISEINSLCHACENNGKSGCVLVFEM